MKKKKIKRKISLDFIDIPNVSVASNIGAQEINEDRCFELKLNTCYFASVFDGLGSGNTGEYASQISIDAITRELKLYELRNTKYAITQAYKEANRLILLRKSRVTTGDEIGASATGIIIKDREVCLANIGNCRAYLIRGKFVQQLTKDDTYIQELLNNGITPSEDEYKEKKHVLTKMLGNVAQVSICTHPLWIWDSKDCDVDENDVIMLCTDGLYEYVTKDDIANATLESNNNYHEACEKLINIAKENGSTDNISLMMIPIVGQIRNAIPPRYQPIVDEKNDEEEEIDSSIFGDSYVENKDINNSIYILHIIILTIIFNLISIMGFISFIN